MVPFQGCELSSNAKELARLMRIFLFAAETLSKLTEDCLWAILRICLRLGCTRGKPRGLQVCIQVVILPIYFTNFYKELDWGLGFRIYREKRVTISA